MLVYIHTYIQRSTSIASVSIMSSYGSLVCLVISLSILFSDVVDAGRHNSRHLGAPPVAEDAILPSDQWFTQNLDHFNPTETRTWNQRYFTNDQYFKANNTGPVFLMIGGEGEASPEWMVAGTWIDYAKKMNALCFQLEHRYYGKSRPTKDMGTKNLVYLTSEQALADLANFIASTNEKYEFDSNTKWILFGGSYPGSLAAWMRLKYPHLVQASISSSGPLLAQTDFMDYYKVVVDALRTSSDDCVNQIKEGFSRINILLQHRVGQRSINTKFRLCDTIENASDLDISTFYENVASNFAGVVQYNKDNRIGKSAKLSNITIDLVCRLMTDKAAGSPVDRLANVNSVLLNINDEKCLDIKYKNMIAQYTNVDWDDKGSEGGRQWMYQTCNEFGFYQTSSEESEIFSNNFPVKYFVQQCMDIFGSKFNADYINSAIRQTNIMYGGLDIQASKIVFVHGSIDPWHALGIVQTKEFSAPAIFITGTAHCANMYPPKDDDLPHLKAARTMIYNLIDAWLGM
ncbi:putative serine protease K12H4.7 [Arctopsyche grandis]|uniref:putative serine protease K12H4.7 n=1 Tax=Arctopsyche grandis TaxID=121162 RepID=UPI00406D69D0